MRIIRAEMHKKFVSRVRLCASVCRRPLSESMRLTVLEKRVSMDLNAFMQRDSALVILSIAFKLAALHSNLLKHLDAWIWR